MTRVEQSTHSLLDEIVMRDFAEFVSRIRFADESPPEHGFLSTSGGALKAFIEMRRGQRQLQQQRPTGREDAAALDMTIEQYLDD